MMRTERYCCVYPGRSALRTMAVVWHVGQVLATSVRSVLFVCLRICGGGCAAELIMRPKTPHPLYFPPSRPSIDFFLSTCSGSVVRARMARCSRRVCHQCKSYRIATESNEIIPRYQSTGLRVSSNTSRKQTENPSLRWKGSAEVRRMIQSLFSVSARGPCPVTAPRPARCQLVDSNHSITLTAHAYHSRLPTQPSPRFIL